MHVKTGRCSPRSATPAPAAKLASGFIFRSVNHSKIAESISGEGICAAFKKRARQAGASASIVARIGGHSCRVGAAQDMATAGYTEALIQQAGGWQDQKEMMKYIAHILAKRGGAAQLAKLQNRLSSGIAKPTLQIQAAAPIDPSLMSRILAALAPFANVAGFSFAPA
jgi:integrase